MTWSGNLVVEGVTLNDDGESLTVRAAITTGDTYDYTAPDGTVTSYPALNSNTEGEVLGVVLELVIAGSATGLEVGDRLSVGGHFDGTPKPAPVDPPAVEPDAPVDVPAADPATDAPAPVEA